ncbi:glutathione peroxidase [Robertmurraya korlensis]|uniref:glutathione peroxidase n=1 Tax=Robertmurraya korlensis TaxID=519977 RepID=UPI00204053C7|nr:glutathione peroxidase [Robertmurraya korlensis]MCM3599875.1 glutathione peroxidase [Robertmurraya korlensis]
MTVYQFEAKKINGQTISLSEYKGDVLLIVNTASNCGFTSQYKELQELYEQYKEKGFTVLGFPCNQFMNQEPGTESDIQSFCEMNFGVTFPLFSKVDVNGKNAHPLFQFLTEEAPGVLGMKAVKWNFTKFLVNRSGEVVERYAPNTNPIEISEDIEKLI